ncbi:MAG TPA: SDR family NAD(P)-dependent oxidoreductase, partial [Vicinamibacterales bacterium]|nr:SDR family NAD(P)-dependent oxidoreductase [Vicinamibacterales bacterium]
MIDLSDRVAIVTGASRGIGRAIAEQLARQGAIVIAAARGENARTVVEEIQSAGGRAEAVALDVTEPAAGERVVASVVERHSRIDILVNNAGITR